jgi:hypothetical protein
MQVLTTTPPEVTELHLLEVGAKAVMVELTVPEEAELEEAGVQVGQVMEPLDIMECQVKCFQPVV